MSDNIAAQNEQITNLGLAQRIFGVFFFPIANISNRKTKTRLGCNQPLLCWLFHWGWRYY